MAPISRVAVCLAFSVSALVYGKNPAVALEAVENTSKMLIVRGYAKGIGGGPQANLDIVQVCKPEVIDEEMLGSLLFSALSKFGAPPDPPTTDPKAITADKEWKTRRAYIDPDTMLKYEKASPVSLQPGHNYYVTFKGRFSLLKRALTFTTIVELYRGVSADRSYPYQMNFDGKFFHNELEKAFAEEIQKYACP